MHVETGFFSSSGAVVLFLSTGGNILQTYQRLFPPQHAPRLPQIPEEENMILPTDHNHSAVSY